ncbi:MAG: hypothetical protein Ct9H90mP2_05070 [Dehalococcoidia bacterium]|nr:MAG: hypothetical protein Ct9H90mP2_05070 [Dehalococcoidia bacterium]
MKNVEFLGYIIQNEPVAESIYLGLFALQHRGQESAGIATSNHDEIFYKSDTGLIANFFGDFDINQLKGNIGIGHTRYSTTGKEANKTPNLFRFLEPMEK